MADTVQHFVERMIPELEKLQTSGIFTENEIKTIIKKRTSFEYDVKRMGKEKVDFLRYIEYELNLDLLRRKRVQRLGIKSSHTGHFSVTRISQLFHRAMGKFRGDVKLWLLYIDFSFRAGAHRRLAHVFAKALQVHSLNPHLWVMAASWEFEYNHNMQAARVLLQRALRLMPKEATLFVEFCRLELMYRQKLTVRMDLFGLDKAALKPKKEQSIEESALPSKKAAEADQMAEDDEDGAAEEIAKAKMLSEPGNTENPAAKTNNPFFEGAIAKVIFQAATKALPGDLKLRQKILEVVLLFPNTDSLQDVIYNSIEVDFPTKEEAVTLVASRPVASLVNAKNQADLSPADLFNAVQKSVELLEAAVARVATPKMVDLALSFFVDQLTLKVIKADANSAQFLTKKLQNVVREASQQQKMSPKGWQLWVEHLLCTNQVDEATSAAKKAVQLLPSSARLWIILLSLLPEDCAVDLFVLATEKTSTADPDAWRVWTMLFKKLLSEETEAAAVTERYYEGLKKLSDANLEHLKTEFLKLVKHNWPIADIRPVYLTAFDRPPNSAAFYAACIEVEKLQLSSQQATIRKLFEYAVSDHGKTSADVWLDFIQWERENKNWAYASRLYWRATKTLIVPDDFVARHTEAVNA